MVKRIRYIDICRAIAIIIIALGHTFVHSEHCGMIFKFLYSFNVALFFILSGYTFKVKDNFFKFIKNKFIRIMIPYFIWATLFAIPFLLLGKSVSSSLNIKSNFDILTIKKNILYGNGINAALKQNTALWFLPALFSMECIYYFIIKLFNNKHNIAKFIVLIIIGYISTKLLKIYLPWGVNTVINIGASTFFLGYLLKEYNILDKIFSNWKYMLLILILGIVCYAFDKGNISYVDYKYANYFLTIVVGACFSIVILYISYLINENEALEYIGKNTMGILIFHKLPILVVQTKLGVISNLLIDSNLLVELAISFLTVALSIFVSLIINYILKKICPITIGEKRTKKIEKKIEA